MSRVALAAMLLVLAAISRAEASVGAGPAHFMRPLDRLGPTGWPNRRITSELSYHGGPVQRAPKIYVTYWGWRSDPAGEAPYLQAFLGGVGGSSWLNTVTQYYDESGTITNPAGQLAGTWSDTMNPEPRHPDAAAVAQEAVRSAARFGFDAGADYVVATPHDRNSPGFPRQYCGYHGTVQSPAGIVAFTYLPYVPDASTRACGDKSGNLLDGVSIVAGHEAAEVQTDPHPFSGWHASFDFEIGDDCELGPFAQVTLSTGTFVVQPLWSDAGGGCVFQYP